MSEAVSKAKLLEWIQSEIKDAINDMDKAKNYNDGILGVCSVLKSEIQSGTFDLQTDVDTIGELDDYTRMLHERNKRLMKELEEAKAETKKWEKEARLQYQLHNEMIERARDFHEKLAEKEAEARIEQNYRIEVESKLNQALEALDGFVKKHFHGGSKANREDYVIMVSAADIYKLRQAIQSIKNN